MLYQLVLDPERCQGCAMCVHACPVNQQIEPQIKYGEGPKTKDVIFQLRNGKSEVLHPEKCLNNHNIKCNICTSSCPRQCIQLVVNA